MKFKKLKLVDIILFLSLTFLIYSIRIEKTPILLSEYQTNNKLNFLLILEESKIRSFMLLDFFTFRNYNNEVYSLINVYKGFNK